MIQQQARKNLQERVNRWDNDDGQVNMHTNERHLLLLIFINVFKYESLT